MNTFSLQRLEGLDHSVSRISIESDRVLNIFVGQPRFFGHSLGRENVLHPVFRDRRDLEIALADQAFDKGVDQTQGDVQAPGQLALAGGFFLIDGLEDFQGSEFLGFQDNSAGA